MFNVDRRQIAYVVSQYRPEDAHLNSEIAAHEAAGLNVGVISLENNRSYAEGVPGADHSGKVTYLPQPLEATTNLSSVRRLAELACKHSLVHLHATSGGTVAAMARAVARLARITYSIKLNRRDVLRASSDDRADSNFADASAILVYSDYNIRLLRTRYGDSIRIQPFYKDARLLNLEFRPPVTREPLIVARLATDSIANVTDLLDTCRILLRRHCVFNFEIYGKACYQDKIRSMIESAALSENVKYVIKSTSAQLRNAISRASAFVVIAADYSAMNTSEFACDHTASLQLLQAMATGTPCLVTDRFSAAELIIDEETGIVEPHRYPDAMAISLQRLLSDSTLGMRLAREARRTVEKMCNVQAQAACVRECFGTPQPASALPHDAILQLS
jgi:glycosyltransferase involved in cell wall biosynthesis